MAAAARDYLAIPASEVAVKWLFNKGRDLLGLQGYLLNAETMRKLMLLRDMYIKKGKLLKAYYFTNNTFLK